jgi:hypothetical protein
MMISFFNPFVYPGTLYDCHVVSVRRSGGRQSNLRFNGCSAVARYKLPNTMCGRPVAFKSDAGTVVPTTGQTVEGTPGRRFAASRGQAPSRAAGRRLATGLRPACREETMTWAFGCRCTTAPPCPCRHFGFARALQKCGDGSNAVMCPAFDAETSPLAQMGSAPGIQTTARPGRPLVLTDWSTRRFDRSPSLRCP